MGFYYYSLPSTSTNKTKELIPSSSANRTKELRISILNMSDNESEHSGSGVDSDAAPDSPQQVEAEAASKGAGPKRPATNHPPYLTMVLDAVQSQQVRGAGVTRPKIVQFIKSKYKLEEVRPVALKKAISKAIEKEQLEQKTGTGMNGTFVLSKSEKQKMVKEEKKKQREEDKAVKQAEAKEAAAKEPKSKPKAKPKKPAATKTKASKDDIDLESEKKVAKKPPVKPTSKAGKENDAPKWKKGDPVRKPKVLQEKVKQLTKSQSASAVMSEPAQPSTSKQRTTKTKGSK